MVEYASSSSFEENLSMTFSVHLNGLWSVMELAHWAETAAYVSLEAGHIVTVERNIGCTVVQNGGQPWASAVTVVTDDGVELSQRPPRFRGRSLWNLRDSMEPSSRLAVEALLLVAGITVLLMRRKQDHTSGRMGRTTPSGPAQCLVRPPAPQLAHLQPSRKRCVQNNLCRNIVDHRSQKRVYQKAGRWSSGSITARNGWHSNNPRPVNWSPCNV